MELAYDCSLLPPDLARCLDLGSRSGPRELTGDPQQGRGEACPTLPVPPQGTIGRRAVVYALSPED